MHLPRIVTMLVVVLSATAAHGQSRDPASSCDLPHASGVSSQQLVSGQHQRAYRLFVPPGGYGISAMYGATQRR